MTDRPYWNAFYRASHPDIEVPSTFASWCMSLLVPGGRLVEFGCGNGRDALFFARNGMQVIACDQSEVAIQGLIANQSSNDGVPTFLACDFTCLADGQLGALNVVYSRFTLHAVTRTEASAALGWAARNLAQNGLLLLEVRSVKGDLFGKGEMREKDAFVYNGHYRRFVRMDELSAELLELGFTIQHAIESAGLAIHNDDDPVVIRMVARRP
jgi:SAM-dependent methyltransferase